MSFLYVPLMAAKRGEFTALTELRGSVSGKTLPLFELPAQKAEKKEFEKSICRTAVAAGKAWASRHAFLDISKWPSNARTENGIHVLEYAFSQFRSSGVAIQPVVGYDRWDDPAYSQALKNIGSIHPTKPCFRFDRESVLDDMLDLQYFSDRMIDILNSMGVVSEDCYAMVDFGDVTTSSLSDLIEATENAVGALRHIGFDNVIVVGGSMPDTVNKAVNTKDEEGCIPRIEMLNWKTVFSKSKDGNLIFGDYIIRSPVALEGVIAPQANAKIRYTIENQFFIVRGHSKQLDSLTNQHAKLSKKLIKSPHYMDPSFSWGDAELLKCSLGTLEIRDATKMIAIDSNHHINAVISEIFEHRQKLVPSSTSGMTNKG